jgi:BirA family biotin operon repressor/biotin-[acetyl-CoA-carboxylase] ligase
MSQTSLKVLEMLSNGKIVSGEEIGKNLGLSRMAVSKAIKNHRSIGLKIRSLPGRGYQLDKALQLIDADGILKSLENAGFAGCRLQVLEKVDSTSDHLLSIGRQTDFHRTICLAECQVGGRGRRERGWYSAPYRNIALSIGWRYEGSMTALSGLSIASGITIARCLHEAGFDPAIGLKWPNDIFWNGRKLGGLLIDVKGEHDGPCQVVLGVGINLSLSEDIVKKIGQPVTTLEHIHGINVDRNMIIRKLLSELLRLLESYQDTGFDAWRAEWEKYDRLLGKSVSVASGGKMYTGVAMGIDEFGALVLNDENDRPMKFLSGEASLCLGK